MVCVVVGAEQAHFFSGHENKQYRPAGRLGQAGVRPRDFEQCGCARSIVERAMTDVVPFDRGTDSEMVYVGGEDDVLVAQSRVGAFELSNNIRTLDYALGRDREDHCVPEARFESIRTCRAGRPRCYNIGAGQRRSSVVCGRRYV